MKMNPLGVRYCPPPPVWWFGHPAIGAAEFAVLMVLLLHSDRQGMCFVGQKTAAAYFGMSRTWANSAIANLAGAGLIERSRQFQSKGGETSCIYRLLNLDGSPLRKGPSVNSPDPATSGDMPATADTSGEPYLTDDETPPTSRCQHADTPSHSADTASFSNPSADTGCRPADTNMTHTIKEDSLLRVRGVSDGFQGQDGIRGRDRGSNNDSERGRVQHSGPSVSAVGFSDSPDTPSLPDNWTPSRDSAAWALARIPDLDLLRFTENFVLSCNAKGYRYRDLDSAWRRWLIEPKTALPKLAPRLFPPVGCSPLSSDCSAGREKDGQAVFLGSDFNGESGNGRHQQRQRREASAWQSSVAQRNRDQAYRMLDGIMAG
jgi:hypothetical protein